MSILLTTAPSAPSLRPLCGTTSVQREADLACVNKPSPSGSTSTPLSLPAGPNGPRISRSGPWHGACSSEGHVHSGILRTPMRSFSPLVAFTSITSPTFAVSARSDDEPKPSGERHSHWLTLAPLHCCSTWGQVACTTRRVDSVTRLGARPSVIIVDRAEAAHSSRPLKVSAGARMAICKTTAVSGHSRDFSSNEQVFQ